MLTDSSMRWLEYIVFVLIVVLLARPAGLYLVRVFARSPTLLDPLLIPIESAVYRISGVDKSDEMSAGRYAWCFILFGLIGAAGLTVLLLMQRSLPGGPAGRYLTTPMTPDLAINTAISFATATTWQAYGGETTLRYLTQALGMVSQNFLAGAAGLALGIAFIRGFARERAAAIGNFWVDLVRALLWVLLPLAVLGSIVFVWQGVPLNFAPYTAVRTLEGGVGIIAQGPVAALEFIKNLGSNGGGFFNANGAHPFEGPTSLVNFLSALAIAVLPASLPVVFGRMTRNPRAGWVLFAVMVALFAAGLTVCDLAESAASPQLAALHVSGGNMEGKEVRFGIGDSALTTAVTSNGATGSYNSMIDSWRPAGVLIPLLNLLLGEVIFGGLGAGLCGMVMIALIAVFLGGLMVGRTPEYLGKKITAAETRLAILYALLTSKVVLVFTAIAVATAAGRAGLVINSGTRGFTEVLFAYASSMANNGIAMAGLNANTHFYNVTTALAMLAGRFGLGAISLALAGKFAAQRHWPIIKGSLRSDSATFGFLVLGTILLLGAVSFLPALALGPIAEALKL